MAADFKGHTGSVVSLDFEPGGKYLVSSSEGNKEILARNANAYYIHIDRSLKLWFMKTLSEREHRL